MTYLVLGFSICCNFFMFMLCQHWYNEAFKLRQELEDLINELETTGTTDTRDARSNDR